MISTGGKNQSLIIGIPIDRMNGLSNILGFNPILFGDEVHDTDLALIRSKGSSQAVRGDAHGRDLPFQSWQGQSVFHEYSIGILALHRLGTR